MEEIIYIRDFLTCVFETIFQEPDSASRKLTEALTCLRDKYDKGFDPRFPNAFQVIVSFVLKIVERCPKTHHEQIIIDIKQVCPNIVSAYHKPPRKKDVIDELLEHHSVEDLWDTVPADRMQILDHVDTIIYNGDIDALLYILKDKQYTAASATRIWCAILDIYTDMTRPLMKEFHRYRYNKLFDWMRGMLDHKRFEELKMYLPTWSTSPNESEWISEIIKIPYNVCRYFKNMFIDTVKFEPSQMIVTFFLKEDFDDMDWISLVRKESFHIGEGIKDTAHKRTIRIDYPSLDDLEMAIYFLT